MINHIMQFAWLVNRKVCPKSTESFNEALSVTLVNNKYMTDVHFYVSHALYYLYWDYIDHLSLSRHLNCKLKICIRRLLHYCLL